MDTFPGCWDHSAAGHVDAQESYEQAAKRELYEELGITDAELHEVAHYRTNNSSNGRKLNRFNTLYRVTVDSTQKLVLQESEVSAAQWLTIKEIKELIDRHPETITDGLAHVLASYY